MALSGLLGLGQESPTIDSSSSETEDAITPTGGDNGSLGVARAVFFAFRSASLAN
jgi:hypothetical protein